MKEYKIEKGIELEPRSQGNIYPLKAMEIGDSFFVPMEDIKVKNARSALSSMICQCGRRLGRKFPIRAVKGGWRIWRIK